MGTSIHNGEEVSGRSALRRALRTPTAPKALTMGAMDEAKKAPRGTAWVTRIVDDLFGGEPTTSVLENNKATWRRRGHRRSSANEQAQTMFSNDYETTEHESSKGRRTHTISAKQCETPGKQPFPSSSNLVIKSNAVQPRVRRNCLPILPPEIWLQIMRHAADYACLFPNPQEPVSFLTQAAPHTHRHRRLQAYQAHLRQKATLSRVSRMWNTIAQELLYEYIWISSGREARSWAERLCGDGATNPTASTGVTQKRGLFKRKVKYSASSIPTLTPLVVGKLIKRLHIETAPFERCSPHDILLILQHCPLLDAFCDLRSIRRPAHPLTLSMSAVVPFSTSVNQQPLASDALIHCLLSRRLKHLTYTNYDYDPNDFAGGARTYKNVVAPRLDLAGGDMKYLEIVLCQGPAHGGTAWVVGGPAAMTAAMTDRREDGIPLSVTRNPAQPLYGAANLLTTLEASFTTTTISSVSLASCPAAVTTRRNSTLPHAGATSDVLCLPALTTLKATLDAATFGALARWNMPMLTRLCILSAECGMDRRGGGAIGWKTRGLQRFFAAHGSKLEQLELGRVQGADEVWVTERPPRATNSGRRTRASSIATGDDGEDDDYVDDEGDLHAPARLPLDAWCPLLKEFICSADAEWDWQTPDWIAPHALLPTHTRVEVIGVRGMERRLVEDWEGALRRRAHGHGHGYVHHVHATTLPHYDEFHRYTFAGGDAGPGEAATDDAYFALRAQFGSLLRPGAFPALRAVRDMSWESDAMRRAGLELSPPSPVPIPVSTLSSPCTSTSAQLSTFANPTPHWWSPRQRNTDLMPTSAQPLAAPAPSQVDVFTPRVLRFWQSVNAMCAARGVRVEDFRGGDIAETLRCDA